MFYNENQIKDKLVKTISEAEERLSRHRIILEDEKKIDELLYGDLVFAVKRNVSRYDMMTAIIKSAQDYIYRENKKEKKDKASLDFITNALKEDFFVEPVKIKDIRFCGIEDYAVEFLVEVRFYTLMIRIPIMQNITEQNFEDSYRGTFSLFVVDGDYYERVAASYDVKDIRKYCEEHYCSGVND